MRLPLEGTLLEKLRKIEALHAGTKVDGEREAARRAAERIRERLAELRGREEDIEYRYRLPDVSGHPKRRVVGQHGARAQNRAGLGSRFRRRETAGNWA